MVGMHEGFGVMTRASDGTVCHGIAEGRPWACDNEAYTRGFDPDRFFPFLERLRSYRETCLFVVCPDVVGDAVQTLTEYRTWAHWVFADGWPLAFVAQDRQEELEFPAVFDWLFIGGTTDWKLGAGALSCIARAKAMRKPVHVGRVNGLRRMHHFALAGTDSVDGTFPCFEPDVARQRLTKGLPQPILTNWQKG